MSCLGVDVGLKNLALCLIKDKRILLWDLYNILDEEHICKNCNRKAKYFSQKEYFCGIHARKIEAKKPVKTKKVSSYTFHELTRKIISKVEDIFEDNKEILDEVSSIVIELQPKINQKMKFTSHVLFTMFSFLCKNSSVRFERASLKLKRAKFKDKIQNTYKNRKKRAIEHTLACLEYVSNSEDYKDLLTKSKVDDLSDAFLLSYNNSK